jgi:hypothetical protein
VSEQRTEGRLEVWRGERRRDVGSEMRRETRAERGAPTAGGEEWRTTAALCLRNLSERKREKT